MSKTRVEMIIETLRDNPERRFTARELAAELIQRYQGNERKATQPTL